MAIAADVIVGWPLTAASIPSGWPREASLDGRFVRSAAGGVGGGGTGGAATHDHPFPAHLHTGASHVHGSNGATGAASTGATTFTSGALVAASISHTHTPTYASAANPSSGNNSAPANFDATSLDPPNFVVIFIKSDGTPTGLPPSCIAYVSGAAPTGWTAHAASANRFLKGAAAAGDGGGTGGTSDVHVHTAPHTHPSGGTHVHVVNFGAPSATASVVVSAAFNGIATSADVHDTPNSAAGDGSALASAAIAMSTGDARPPWKKLLPVQNTSGSNSTPNTITAMWLGTVAAIPARWARVTTVDGLFVNGAANSGEVGNTGGAATHTHADAVGHSHLDTVHGHTSTAAGAPTSTATTAGGGATQAALNTHVHTAASAAPNNAAGTSGTTTAAATANSSNNPTYTDVIYISFSNATPGAPTIDLPVGGSAYSGSIGLRATATDSDGDTWFGRWEYSPTGGAPWTSIGDGAVAASGAASVLTWNITALQPGFQYKVRVKAVDLYLAESAFVESSSFIIGPGFAGLFADSLTTTYEPSNLTTSYYAENLTATFEAVET